MCEYTYENGKKCRLKPLEGSKYCALHIPRKRERPYTVRD